MYEPEHGMSGDRQVVHVESGVGYGVVGADLHVFGDGVPLYLLTNWRSTESPDTQWLRDVPSRMLNANFGLVRFTGRTMELEDLDRWRDGTARLAVRWLYGPGGQGKTRLAGQFADRCRAAGWKVVTALHGPGTVLPADRQEDLRLGDSVGVLVIVDYADRWPLSHLTWLFSNALLHRPGKPARVLLLARTADSWPAVRAALTDRQADVSTQFLGPVPGESRSSMFKTARDVFASCYEIDEPRVIVPPGFVDHPDFGLTLALHMAALVAVDAHVNPAVGRRLPADLAGLTCYLLDREHLHWRRQYGDPGHGVGAASTFRTPPEAMNRTVFSAALTGAVPPDTGISVVERLDMQLAAEQVLRDHALCYPPAGGTVLAPLYPDRLAEDFLALTVPGHTADFPAQAWAPGTATAVLQETRGCARAITFLASASARWPHLGPAYLFPLLNDRPELAVEAGSAALSALASIPDVEVGVLEAVATQLPLESDVDLDSGVADVTHRLVDFHLATAGSDQERAELWTVLGWRFSNAGRYGDAVDAATRGLEVWDQLAAADPHEYGPYRADALHSLVRPLFRMGRWDDATVISQRGVAAWREVARADPERYSAKLSAALVSLSASLAGVGKRQEALAAAEQATALDRTLHNVDADHVAAAWDNLGSRLTDIGRYEDALAQARSAVAITERLAATKPGVYRPRLARQLGNLHIRLVKVGRWADATVVAERVVELWRALAATNPTAFELELARSLNHLGVCRHRLGRPAEAVVATTESVDILRRLAADDLNACEPELAAALDHLGHQLAVLDRHAEALAVCRESVHTYQLLARAYPDRYEVELAKALDNMGIRLTATDQHKPALDASLHAAEILQRLAADEPSVFRSDLARAKFNLAMRFTAVGRHTEALAAIMRSVELRRLLVADDETAFEPDLARSLLGYALLCVELGLTERMADASRAIDECVTRLERLASVEPGTHVGELATAVQIRAMVRRVAPRPQRRRSWFRRAITDRRRGLRDDLGHREDDSDV